MLGRPYKFFLSLIILFCFNSWANEGKLNSTENIIFSSETLSHISGSATRNEWRSGSGGKIIQLEIKKARSGQILVEKLKLIYQNKVGWRIEDIDGNVKLMINPKLINSGKSINLKINTQVWAITLSNEEMPKVIPGIATETEPRVDIFMKLLQ